MKNDDKELIRQVLNGDCSAYEMLVDRYRDMVYRVCFRFMNNHEDAMDMSQEVLIRIYNNLGRFGYRCSLSTWIYRIAVNVCLNELKRQNRLKVEALSEEFLHDAHGAAACKGPEELLELKEIRRLIHDEIAGMGKKHEIIMRLRLFSQKSFSEIAGILNIRDSSARSAFARGKKQLRESIKAMGEESWRT